MQQKEIKYNETQTKPKELCKESHQVKLRHVI